MVHKFESKNKDMLDNEWRRQNLPPLDTLKILGLSTDDIVADIGCGIGYFTISAANIVDPNNKVYALDTSDEMLSEVERRASVAESFNIVGIKTDEYELKLENKSTSFSLLVNVLHEVEDKNTFLKEIKRILKDKGKLAIIEWEMGQDKKGPPIQDRIDKNEVIDLLVSEGFEIDKTLNLSEFFYGIVAVNTP
ncbi:Methyltransferase domain-containing protein [Desulfonispora thiosulfatigenes DSM 11270]|uniref:Methyltransferase domain-containing protein n=1 Tax=Desulfonispora thiosulfatigenes DSM 11270 TaxID=656914 RepID=A0A1W1UDC6_DESTI|nr:methyltransferase domain-containing protein [Desulfonispora thiosulfatigenes]SMB78821.1 Methyltransferase domain-containing protein [Desulfonispora thiosulfatigenes DSM 11270]